LETVYKLVEYAGRPTMKLSEGKQSMPGAKQVYRSHRATDVLALRTESPPADAIALMVEVMRDGKRTRPPEQISAAADRLAADLVGLPDAARLLRNPTVPPVRVSDQLLRLTREVADSHRPAR
jgi:nicotinate phosphoribosyltransferase